MTGTAGPRAAALPARADALRARQGLPWSVGVYLAVNAVPDLRLVMDGPDCCFYRCDLIQGNHDLTATLLDVSGAHRVVTTAADVDAVVLDRSETIQAALRAARAAPGTSAVLLGALPMAYLTGAPYEVLAREIEAEAPGVPVRALSGRSLQTDWHGGFADALLALADALPLSGPPRPEAVALVGYLADRGEQDHAANVRELTRLLGAIGLDAVSVWLSGAPTTALAAAGEAATVVSLPHGRAAARRLAERTGARLVETALPLGLPATEAWLRAVAATSGREARAEAVLAAELDRVVPRVEWLAAHTFPGRRLVAVADPHHLPGLAALWEELGGEVAALRSTAAGPAGAPAHPALPAGGGVVDAAELDEALAALAADGVDLALGTAFQLGAFHGHGLPFLEFGVPCHTEHALHSRPYLGFEGWLCLVEQLANRLRLAEWLRPGGV
jgi:nitrogenase molybdenum-iron protein alpha/beta subunit